MRRRERLRAALLAAGVGLAALAPASATNRVPGTPEALQPLEVERIDVDGMSRSVRYYVPARLASPPAVVVALHGGGGDGERLRRLTGGAFDRIADRHGFVVAYPDGVGGYWNDCRARTPFRGALDGVNDVAFLRDVVRRAAARAGGPIAGSFAVGYSNGGHLVFRLALEAPEEFSALASIGAHLPIAEERACEPAGVPVSLMLVSGTEDSINPWDGGPVVAPGKGTLGHVVSAAATAAYFRELAGAADEVPVERHADRDERDGATVETRRWTSGAGREVVLMAVRGGGHTLPHPAAAFPAEIVGPTCRDLDGAAAIWEFFARHGGPG